MTYSIIDSDAIADGWIDGNDGKGSEKNPNLDQIKISSEFP